MTGRIIGRLPSFERSNLLRRVLTEAGPAAGSRVAVDYSWNRSADEVRTIVGYLVCAAYAPGGAVSEVLVVDPLSPAYRHHALSSAQLVRIAYAHVPEAAESPSSRDRVDSFGVRYWRGSILAGPDYA